MPEQLGTPRSTVSEVHPSRGELQNMLIEELGHRKAIERELGLVRGAAVAYLQALEVHSDGPIEPYHSRLYEAVTGGR